MTKLLVLTAVVCLVACAQLAHATPVDDAINNDLRESLKGYYKILEGADATYKADLQRLIEQTETALKATDHSEKTSILNGLSASFTPEFNEYLNRKIQEQQIDGEINTSLDYYKTLLTKEDIGTFKPEVEKTIEHLTSLLQETDAQKKVAEYARLDKYFSADFQAYLKKQSQPFVEGGLKSTIEFLGTLLAEPEPKYKEQIGELKSQAEAGLSTGSLEDEQRVLYEVSNPKDVNLFNYLKERYVELH